jgi:hypothetical protein
MTPVTIATSADSQVFHQFGRLQTMTEWWEWCVLLAITLAVLAYVAVMYRKDSVDLPRGYAWGLILLRVVAFLGVLFYFLDLEKREERRIVRPSRASVLVDTSLSMGIQDNQLHASRRRIDEVIEEFANRDFLDKLRENHDIVVYRFDQATAPTEIASLPRKSKSTTSNGETRDNRQQQLAVARVIAGIAGLLFIVAFVSLVAFLIWGRRPGNKKVAQSSASDSDQGDRDGSYSLLVALVAGIAGVVVLCAVSLRYPNLGLAAIFGQKPLQELKDSAESPTKVGPSGVDSDQPNANVAWSDSLTPRGAETRLGDAVRWVINRERGGPIAGVIVLSDGGSNAGSESQESIANARAAGIPVFCVGIGSDRRPANVNVVDLEAPPRVYPNDAFPLTGFLQAFGFAGRTIKVELISKAGRNSQDQGSIEDVQQTTIGPDGELTPVKFQVTPTEVGIRTYAIRIVPPSQDSDQRDNEKSATVQVVERKNRVLLFAGAATREFQFLRNMLFRDKNTTVDVLIQSGVPGISQEASAVLFEFPKLAEEFFEYDCIVAFDPDWSLLDEQQTQLIERWVAEKAGGLVLVAGLVETPKLLATRGANQLETIRGLYPVAFFNRGSAALSLSRTSSDSPWPLSFSRDGQEADFLRLEDDPLESERAWTSYSGIYGYFATKGPKPGAKVFARFSDPTTAVDGELPVYMAAQFYGAGRVFFQGSGEMWRLRQASDSYFERYYTKLIRWVSQGRLLRDSTRGLLLVDKDRCLLGETISVQAVLTNSQHEPLTAGEVMAVLVDPESRRRNLPLRRVENSARPGTYAAQFSTPIAGDYRVELPLPDSADEVLSRDVRARIPAMETERPERNDALLKDLAQKTGGAYYVGIDAAMNRQAGQIPMASLIEPQDQVTFLPGTPDKNFDRLLMTWLMGIICGALCLEWLVRRLLKLA